MEPVRTLPAWTYRSPAFHRAEREAIFRSGWLLAGHVCQLERPGDYVTLTVAGEPILTIRGGDGRLRAFSNVCRHRAARVADGAGNCGKALRCPYHGWTYGLDGRLLGVPERSGFPGFDKDANALWPLRCDEAAGFVFVNLAPDPEPLADYLGGLPEFLAPYRPERLVPFASGSSVLPFNWKVVVDNYLEGYHIPVGHPGLLRLLDYKRYLVTTTDAKVSYVTSPIRDKPSRVWQERLYQRLVRPMPHLPESLRTSWNYAFAFPGATWNLYPDQIDTWCVYPIDEVRTRTTWRAFRAPGQSDLRDRAVRTLNVRVNSLVNDEDNDLCERVQEGLGSALYRSGILGGRENGLRHFHDLVREAVPAALLEHEADGVAALADREPTAPVVSYD
jgi:phenylpropionate dioxygenase-like ring-hydroxylating dioxygenase large terminal subunit